MIMFNNNLKKNIFLKRIFSIKNAIFAYSLASFLDIFIILKISSIFSDITKTNLDTSFTTYFFQCFFYIIIRTIFVFLLKRYTFNQIFYKKLKDEKNIVEISSYLKITSSSELFYEKIIGKEKYSLIKKKYLNDNKKCIPLYFFFNFYSIIFCYCCRFH